MNTRINLKIITGILILFLALLAASYLFLTKRYPWLLIPLPVILIQTIHLIRQQQKIYIELGEFMEAVKYRDFSRRFNTNNAPPEIRTLRKGFNEINGAFRNISKEKETQYQYLQRIMEMVNTGILSYNAETLEVQWINDSLRQLLHIPYLKTVASLEKRNRPLYNDLTTLKPGDSKISTFHSGLESTKILLSATAFKTEGKSYILIGFHNINSAVNETESEAWRKLLRVMTHEIMNSVAPISSLADTLQHRIKDHQAGSPVHQQSTLNDINVGIHTIKKRSDSLLRFAETYRSLNKITAPDMKTFFVCDLFENIFNLMEPGLKQKDIALEILLKDPGLQLEADSALIEQVLINLIVNAVEAVKDRDTKTIILSGELSGDKILLRVADNGKGMAADILDKIFIPFFTTKKNGSGIGLSLGRQILQAHHGALQVVSEEEKGTVFTLQFQALHRSEAPGSFSLADLI